MAGRRCTEPRSVKRGNICVVTTFLDKVWPLIGALAVGGAVLIDASDAIVIALIALTVAPSFFIDRRRAH